MKKLFLFFLAIIFLGLSVGLMSWFTVIEKYLEKYALNQLTLTAELAEGNLFAFWERQKLRAADWTSDGHIRRETEDIAKLSKEPSKNAVFLSRAKQFGAYLKNKKQPLDSTIILTDIFNADGKIIASSNEARVGAQKNRDILNRRYSFDRAVQGSFGLSLLGGVVGESDIGHPADPLFHISTPILSLDSDKVVGVLVNHILLTEVGKIISGRMLTESGTDGPKGRFKTLDIYLVNQDGLMLTPSRFIQDAVLKQKVDTMPVRACLKNGAEVSGAYKNYLNDWVYGSSLCAKDKSWVLVVETNQNEIELPFAPWIKQIMGVGLVIFGALIAAGVFLFSRKLD